MTITNILTVGVPETFLSIAFMLVVLRGKIVEKNENILVFVVKQIVSIIFILFCFYNVRSRFNGLILITFINVLIYSVAMKVFWKFNNRQGLLAGSLAMFVIVFSEITTVVPITKLIIEGIMKYNFLDSKIIWSLPTRIIQSLTILLILKRNINLKINKLLVARWDKLTHSQKYTSVMLNIFILVSVIFAVNYSELFMKMKTNNIDISMFETSINILLIQSVIYLLVALMLLNRTSKYESYKTVLYSMPEDIIKALDGNKKNSDQDQLEGGECIEEKI